MTSVRRGPVSDPWTVAIHASASDWKPTGTGVLIDRLRVLTCAHVATAAGAATTGAATAGAATTGAATTGATTTEIFVAFPKIESEPVRIRVAAVELPDGPPHSLADVAVLVLEAEAPEGAVPAPLRDPPTSAVVDEAWWAFGYPNSDVLGSSAHGLVDSSLSYGWVRLRTESTYVVERGFSGAGLWSPAYQAVVGLVGQAQPAGDHRGDARALTLRQISAWLPQVKLDALTAWSAAAADEGALAAWGWRLADDPESGRHWVPRARGVSSANERGFRFRGRTAALSDVVEWLTRPVEDRRALVVTGSPGSGKSAVLGRIVTTADAGVRNALPAGDTAVRAPLGSIACAVHAKGKTALEVAVEIARAASTQLPARLEDLPPALRTELEQRSTGRRFTIVIDALDEAAGPADARRIVTELVLPLVRMGGGIQVVVGSRRRDDGGDLLDAFAYSRHVIDLDDTDHFAGSDLVEYALATLRMEGDERPGNPYADDLVARPVAERIAELAQKSFLVAGLIARMHGLHDTIPADPGTITFAPSADDALRRYLERLTPVDGVSATTILTVLAFAESPGLTPALWRLGLRALGAEVDELQLTVFARSAAANFLIETTGTAVTGQTSYRLFHQALNDALLAARADLHPRSDDERVLTRTWLEHWQNTGWAHAPAYLLRSLPGHAHAAGLVEQLLLDDDYLRHADLRRLLSVTDAITSGSGRDRSKMLHFSPHAIATEPALRAAMLQLTTTMERLDPPFPARDDAPYRARWAAVTPRIERNTLTGHTGAVGVVCVVPSGDGSHLLVSAGRDTSVRVWDPSGGRLLHKLTGHGRAVTTMCAVPVGNDGHLLASAGRDASVRIWDPSGGHLVRTLTDNTGPVTVLCAIPAGENRHLLASAGDDEAVRVWNASDGRLLHTLADGTGPLTALCVVPADDEHLLAAAGGYGGVRVWDPVGGRLRHNLTGHTDWVDTMCAVPVGGGRHLLASGSRDESVRVWDPSDGRLLHTLTGHTGAVTAVCAVPADRGNHLLASAGSNGEVRVWDPSDGRLLHTLTGHTGAAVALCTISIDADHHLLVSAGRDASIRVWNPLEGHLLHTLTGHSLALTTVCPVPTGGDRHLLASAGADQTVRLWTLTPGGTRAAIPAAGGHDVLTVVTLPHDGRRLAASGGHDGAVRIWDPADGRLLDTSAGHTMPVDTLCVIPTGGNRHLLGFVDHGTAVRVWDPFGDRIEHTLTGHTGEVTTVCAVRAGGKDGDERHLLASASRDESVRTWDPIDHRPVRHLTGHTNWVTALCPIPVDENHDLLASGSRDKSIRIWDPTGGRPLHILTGHTDTVTVLCPIPVGRSHLLASGSRDKSIRIWDPTGGRPLHVLTGHTGTVSALCAVPVDRDRYLLASADDGGEVRLWNPADGRLHHHLASHTDVIRALAVVRLDGRSLLASASDDQSVRLFDPASGQSTHVVHVHQHVRCLAITDATLLIGLTTGLIAVEVRSQPV